ncbi:MAG: hypothetical protein DYG99_12195 [Bacteroidetes bacterium CHB5]|nr:hypothetical protein [Bacteroidetes bacterium CHB5]
MAKSTTNQVVLFVEGETEKEFFEALLKFYRENSSTEIKSCKIINVKGIGRFESKVAPKMKYEIIPKFPEADLSVVCAYDTDVFELAQKPPTNWNVVESKLAELGITDFSEVKAKRMIEDWFLEDLAGLCKFLKLTPVPKKIEGKDGLDKIKKLFRRKDKLYLKGHNTNKFIPSLDIETIRDKISVQLLPLEKSLGVTLK